MNGENEIVAASVRPSLIAAWLRTNLRLTDKRVEGTTPNTFLGLIPAGKKQITQPLNRVASIALDSSISFGAVLVALIGVVLLMSDAAAFGVILILLGAVNVPNLSMKITDNGGSVQEVSVSILDRSEVEDFVAKANDQLATGNLD